MNKREAQALEEHFEHLHKNPPAPFNLTYDPEAADRMRTAAESMEADGFYDSHTREECAAEIKRRAEGLKHGN